MAAGVGAAVGEFPRPYRLRKASSSAAGAAGGLGREGASGACVSALGRAGRAGVAGMTSAGGAGGAGGLSDWATATVASGPLNAASNARVASERFQFNCVVFILSPFISGQPT